MGTELKGVVAVTGGYGNGKTEVSVNLALTEKKGGSSVRIADLDLVNPYFRMREARKTLTDKGVEVVLPDEKYMNADLPVLTSGIYGMFHAPRDLEILDVGGGDSGCKVLGALHHVIGSTRLEVLQVVNPYKMDSGTIAKCTEQKKEIQEASGLKITGVIGNANLMDETTVAHLRKGYDFVQYFADQNCLPLKFITVPSHLMPNLENEHFDCPILPLDRLLAKSWNVYPMDRQRMIFSGA